MTSTSEGKLAFGVEPSTREYRLRLARYVGLAELLRRVRVESPSAPYAILDAGCGKGRLPRYYGRSYGDDRVRFFGIDISPRRLEGARSAAYDALQRASVTEIPYGDAVFDAVACEQVLEHLNDALVGKTLSEFRRVLKPGGHLVLGVPVFTEPELWIKPVWLWGRKVLSRITGSTPDHEQHFSVAGASRMAARHGFRVLHIQGYRLFSFFNQWFEDLKGYYLAHRRMGKYFPGLCGEVDLLCRKV